MAVDGRKDRTVLAIVQTHMSKTWRMSIPFENALLLIGTAHVGRSIINLTHVSSTSKKYTSRQ